MTDCITRLRISLLLLYLLYLSNFLSFHASNNETFVKGFSITVQARIIIFGIKANDDLLYRWVENQPVPAYSPLYSSNFLSFHTSNNKNLAYMYFQLLKRLTEETWWIKYFGLC